MVTPETSELLQADRARRYELNKLAETQRWVHHVADLNTGEVLTFPLDGPVMPISRAERLSRLGHLIDWSIFDRASYTLTPRSPYNASPEAWLVAYFERHGGTTVFTDYNARTNRISWDKPDSSWACLHGHFGVTSSVRRSVVSLSLGASSFEGVTGHLLFDCGLGPRVNIPIDDHFDFHTMDFTCAPHSLGGPLDFWMFPEFIDRIIFHSLSLRTAPPELSPE